VARFLAFYSIISIIAFGTSSVVLAQIDAEESYDDEARGLFLAGRAAFDAGRFEEALTHFERAYDLSQRPGLLFNIGHTAERLRRDDRAIEAFTAYLEAVPNADNRTAIEARLRLLEEARETHAEPDAEAEAEAETGPAEPSEPDSGSSAARWALGVSGGAVAVGGVVALVLAASAASTVDDAQDGTPWTELEGDYDRARRARRAGAILLGVGATLAVVGVVLPRGEREVEVGFGLGGASVRGTF